MSRLLIATLLLGVLCASLGIAVCAPTVTVAQGSLSGLWLETRGGRRFAAFRGIPYAAPPVKQLRLGLETSRGQWNRRPGEPLPIQCRSRLKSPMPLEPWEGIKQATDGSHQCVQHYDYLGIDGEEDCLYLNIFTPNVTKSSKLPVLFFIHGGTFKHGSGGSFLYGPEYLLDEDIVLVTINYRLGVFGFLTLEDRLMPGNLGLKDQRAALRWVRNNIAEFGGDRDKVTLFGESAGAASVHYHMMFNADEGLFRAGILHSGSAYTWGSFQKPGDQKPLVDHILSYHNCTSNNSSIVVECLRKVRPYKLFRTAISFFPPSESLKWRAELSPVIEPGCVEDAFITSDPWNKTISFPMIIGTNQYEAISWFVEVLKDETNTKFKKLDAEYEDILPYNLMIDASAVDPKGVSKSLRTFYLKDHKIDREHFLPLVDLYSDGMMNYGASTAVKRNLNNTYLYSFNYLGAKSAMNFLSLRNTYGAGHIDEIFLFFNSRSFPGYYDNKTEDDKLLSTQLIKMWTNFVATLEPFLDKSEVNWEPVSSPDLEHLTIKGPSNFTMDSGFYKERMAFWDTLPFRTLPLNTDLLICHK